MEFNKENVQRWKRNTKIPVPIAPLPTLPKYLLNNAKAEKEGTVRKPLNILSQCHENEACTSSSQVQNRERESFQKIDTKYVTVRTKSNEETSDWKYKIFQDHAEDILSNDDSNERVKKEVKFCKDDKKTCVEEPQLAVTPSIRFLENQSVRNIKRSLKRPHSRELQGLSPLAEQKDQGTDEKVKRRLQFSGLKSPDYWEKLYMRCVTQEYSEDILQHLLAVEKKPLDIPMCSRVTRSSIVNWLIRINGPQSSAIVQTACWYLDSILGICCIYVHRVNVVAAACYWIAQKLHGPVVSAPRLARRSGFAFSADKLVEAEKIILVKLNFPPQPVVPQDFIGYLSWWCDPNHPSEIEAAATFACMSGLEADTELCNEFPSVIGAAAVAKALLLLGRRELINRLKDCPVYQAAKKKTLNMSFVVSLLRQAVHNKSASNYECKCPAALRSPPVQ